MERKSHSILMKEGMNTDMSTALSSSTTARTVLLPSSQSGSTASRRRRYKRLHNGVIGTENAKGQLAEWSGLVHEHSSQVKIMLDTTCIYTGCCDSSPACRISHDNDTTKFTFSLHKLYFDLLLYSSQDLSSQEESGVKESTSRIRASSVTAPVQRHVHSLTQSWHLCCRRSALIISLTDVS